MNRNQITVAALAAVFSLGTSAALLSNAVAHATPAFAARADGDHSYDKHDDEDDQGDERGNHKHHKNKHHRNGGLYGTISSIYGNNVGLRLNNGQTIALNDQPALDAGRASNLAINESVVVSGSYGQNGVFYATQIVPSNTNGYPGNGGQYGGNPNPGYTNCNASTNGLTSVTGIESTPIDGSGYFQIQPIGGAYTVHVTSQTCLKKQPGIGTNLRVFGRAVGDGRTIEAVLITG